MITETGFQIVSSDFAEVGAFWRKYLWDERYDFKETSAMLFGGGYDLSIEQKYKPLFFVARCNGEVVGAISGHATAQAHYRFRGLTVRPDFRGQGVAQALLEKIKNEALNYGAEILWGSPRKGAWRFYEKYGFRQASEFTHVGFLFGPNCYAFISLSQNQKSAL